MLSVFILKILHVVLKPLLPALILPLLRGVVAVTVLAVVDAFKLTF